MKRRVLIIEDQPLVSQAFAESLEQSSDGEFEVVGIADTVDSAVELFDRERPNTVLLDLQLGDESGIECLSAVTSFNCRTDVVVVTSFAHTEMAIRSLVLGAKAVIDKRDVRLGVFARQIMDVLSSTPDKPAPKSDDLFKILVIDDSKSVRYKIPHLLEKRQEKPFIFDTAEDGQIGVAKAKAFRPDVITMDLDMPRMSGVEAIREIIAYDDDARIIVISSSENAGRLESLAAGARYYIHKSELNPDRLAQAVDAVLN